MNNKFAVYKNKEYSVDISGNIVMLVSECEDEGFEYYKDVLGNVHTDLFQKEVKRDTVELIYSLSFSTVYKGESFEPLSINKSVVEYNKVVLFTSDENVARKYGFNKKEQFVFEKEVKLDELDEFISIKTPILEFKDKKIVIEKFRGSEIIETIKDIINK